MAASRLATVRRGQASLMFRRAMRGFFLAMPTRCGCRAGAGRALRRRWPVPASMIDRAGAVPMPGARAAGGFLPRERGRWLSPVQANCCRVCGLVACGAGAQPRGARGPCVCGAAFCRPARSALPCLPRARMAGVDRHRVPAASLRCVCLQSVARSGCSAGPAGQPGDSPGRRLPQWRGVSPSQRAPGSGCMLELPRGLSGELYQSRAWPQTMRIHDGP